MVLYRVVVHSGQLMKLTKRSELPLIVELFVHYRYKVRLTQRIKAFGFSMETRLFFQYLPLFMVFDVFMH